MSPFALFPSRTPGLRSCALRVLAPIYTESQRIIVSKSESERVDLINQSGRRILYLLFELEVPMLLKDTYDPPRPFEITCYTS